MRRFSLIFGVAVLLLAALAGRAQVAEKKTLTLDGAEKVIAAAKAEAKKLNAPGGVIAVVDDGGNLMALARMDGTFAAGANISIGKARTAALFKKPTKFFEDVIKNGVVIVGSPNTVREKLAEYQDLAGFNTSLTKTQFGTLPDDMTRANMQAIAQEILPHFRDRLPQGKRQAAAE